MIKRAPAAGRRRLLPTIAVTALVAAAGLGLAATADAAPAPGGPAPVTLSPDPGAGTPTAQESSTSGTLRYAVAKPVCDAAPAGQYRCMALRLVDVPKGTPGAKAYSVPAAPRAASPAASGPSGGFAPSGLAAAYGYNPSLRIGATQTVAIVDAYDDPHALADLNAFDRHYGLPAETSKSFRKVNEYGKASPLPTADKGWSGEIALDIEAVRSVCNKCKIILVEANKPSVADLAQAVNTAAKLGATEISNSYGGPERKNSPDPKQIRHAYNHPGIVITASTGDDGWFSWDNVNGGGTSYNAANTPSSYPTVVAVGGTALAVNPDGTRSDEQVWNENGPEDSQGLGGASGGGCSWNYTAPAFQAGVSGYANTGCGSHRLAGDVAALADPYTGFDVYNTYGGNGWVTIGGTSLSSPLIAGMWALAGGSAGVAYPAQTLYKNFKQNPASVYDVTVGGNSFCGGDTAANCYATVQSLTGSTGNPNNLANTGGQWLGLLDCGFAYNASESTRAANTQCNAVTGYDGPSGVGAPAGLALFTAMQPSVTMKAPTLLKRGVAATFAATNFRDPIPGSALADYEWNWGDGHTTTTKNASVSHKYLRTGTYKITLTAIDNGAKSSAPVVRKYALGYAPVSRINGPGKVRVSTTHTWRAAPIEKNTGGVITKVIWTVNGKKVGTSRRLTGRFTKTGRYRLALKVFDNSGLHASKLIAVRVTR